MVNRNDSCLYRANNTKHPSGQKEGLCHCFI